MNRRLLHRVSPVMLVLFALLAPPVLAQTKRPNVLFLFGDDQRADTIHALGNDHIRTPNLDRLTEVGVTFRNAYCMGSWSGAVCIPSRAMVNTGRTLWRIERDDKPANDMAGLPLWGEMMRDAGYVTYGVGKWHNGGETFARSFDHGNAVLLGGMSNHFDVPTHVMREDGSFERYDSKGVHSSELFAEAAIQFLERHAETERDRPFFLYVAFTAPHDPRDPPRPYREWYYEHPPPLPPNVLPQHPFDNGQLILRDENLAPWPRPRAMLRDQLAEYYGLITHLDAQIGRVLEALRSVGAYDNTIIVYAADHGLAVGSHGLLGKQSVYEHSMRAPLIFVGPGIPGGEQREAFAYLLDILPTVCDLADVETAETVDGMSLVPAIHDPAVRTRDHLYLGYQQFMRAIRDERWKLIRYPHIDHTQLFDLANDPHETTNLADDPEHADRVMDLMRELRKAQIRYEDDHPLTAGELRPMIRDLTGHEREPDRWQPEWIVEKYFGG